MAESGKIGGVPRLSIPHDMPGEVQTVIDALGNRARTEILRLLATRPHTAVELAIALDVNHASIHRHLRALEDAWLVQADQPAGNRVGQAVHWTTNVENVNKAVRVWLAYVCSPTQARPARD